MPLLLSYPFPNPRDHFITRTRDSNLKQLTVLTRTYLPDSTEAM